MDVSDRGLFYAAVSPPLSLRSLFYPLRIIQKEQNPALEIFKVAKPVRQPLERLERRIVPLGEAIVEPRQAGVQQFFSPCQCVVINSNFADE